MTSKYGESRQDLRCSISVVEDVSEAIGHNVWASEVLRYFYGIIKWTKWDVIKLDRMGYQNGQYYTNIAATTFLISDIISDV